MNKYIVISILNTLYFTLLFLYFFNVILFYIYISLCVLYVFLYLLISERKWQKSKVHDRAIKINYRVNDQRFRLMYLLFNNKYISRETDLFKDRIVVRVKFTSDWISLDERIPSEEIVDIRANI